MQAEPSPSWRETSAPNTPPHCVFVTGPRGAGKTRWLQLQIHDLAEKQPGIRCAILLAEEGRTRMERFVQDTPGVTVRHLLLPCTCCPALADLPGALRALVAAVRPDWLFVEVPVLAAVELATDLDRALGWPRELVVCLDHVWATHQREHTQPPFQMVLLELADRVMSNPTRGGVPRALLRSRVVLISPPALFMKNTTLALCLIVLAALWRIISALEPSLSNVAPITALAFCGAAYFRNWRWWLVPFLALMLSDLWLNYYHATQFGSTWSFGEILLRLLCFAAAVGVGRLVARRRNGLTLLGGALGSALIFYVGTNTVA